MFLQNKLFFYIVIIITIHKQYYCFDIRPIIAVRGGDLEIGVAPGHNVKFKVSNGGKLLLEDKDLSAIVNDMSTSLDTLQQCKTDSKEALQKISRFEGDTNAQGLLNRLSYVENLSNTTYRLVTIITRPLRRRLNNIQKRLNMLLSSITLNECNSGPCQHGGTCQDLYNAYNCICPSNWEGGQCEKDVNECTKFEGTELGCQNKGKCINTPGGYECKCADGWYGIHCTKRTEDCNNSAEVCGHGSCIQLSSGYTCLCDQGWKTDGTKKACTVDINECDSYHPPCSSNPPVTCVNLPGSFYCGHCPPGYTGNGFYCSDINECEILNGGCSMYPMVQCVNIPGSRMCGRCPPGYNGNGITCTFQGVCGVNNGGCHPMAQCRENPRISNTYVECICPPGYSGDGFGSTGCNKGAYDSCASNPCQYGTCTSTTTGYICNCTSKYTGKNCDIRKDSCSSNPCQNGGTCKAFLISFFCACPPGYAGTYCETSVSKCGQLLDSTGEFIYPPEDIVFNRNSQISCAWRIKASPAKVVNVTFNKVYLPSCSHNYIQMHDGKDTGSPLLGRFCETNLKNGSTMVSTTDFLYLWLRADALAPKPFVNISWNSIIPVCGSPIEVSEPGTFKSPGSPQKYPANRNCFWTLKAPQGKRIKFTFYHLDIGNNLDCTKDYISFNEGLEPTQKLFFQACKSGIVEPVQSPSNEVTVHLHTVGSYTGFLIHYSLLDGVTGCGGIYTHSTGVISSPKVSPDGTNIITCEYRIQIGYEARLSLHFNRFSGFNNFAFIKTICIGNKYLAIYQGKTIDSPLVGKYCGTSKPPDLTIIDSQVLIVYRYSLNDANNPSFELEYKTVCGGTYTADSSTIQSDNYPTPVTVDSTVKCVYLIMSPPGNRIQIDIEDLNFGNETNWSCEKGSFKINEGNQENATNLRTYCGKTFSGTIYSKTNFVTLEYTQRAGATVVGFKLSYQTIGNGECGGVRTENNGFLQSPRNLNSYDSGLNCTWLISAPAGYIIEFNWLQFNLEESYNCLYDSIEIYDNITTSSSHLMGKYCGNRKPPVMTTTSNVATVFFKIDTLHNFDGFSLTYHFLQLSDVCGGNFFSPTGTITTPNYPSPYPDNRNCIWVITAPAGHQILLNVTEFDVEMSSNCRYDYLEIANGGSILSPNIGKFCGKHIPERIVSHTNKLFLHFKSDKTKSKKGFHMTWIASATGCGGSLTSTTGVIISPNYPEPYSRNAECFWKIAVSAGSKIQAVFSDLDLEYLNGCYMDYVNFYDGPSTESKKIGTYCRMTSDTPIIKSSGNHLAVKFHSDINFQGRGFQLQYTASCKTNVTGFKGVIENPNYPNIASADQECEWEITVPNGNRINITFSHFSIEESINNCDKSYLEVKYEDSQVYETKTYGTYCNSNPPEREINIKSNKAFVKFRNFLTYPSASIFRLEWTLSGCGGFLTRPEGTLQTPNYPQHYPIDTTCHWHIQTDFGKSIEITFYNIDMELQRYCGLDYIKVINGPDMTYPEIANFCHSNKEPTVITGTGRDMTVIFTSDTSYNGKGFNATYKTVDTKCGGKMTASSGSFHSPNYPSNYDKNDSCSWLIEVAENHRIDLLFDSVDLLRTCDRTYIKVYDGPTEAYPLLVNICGSDKPPLLTSKTNHLYIEMVTHALITTKGFLARYSTACGARIKTQGGGIIEFSAQTIATTNVTNCTWTIEAENPTQHILLRFSKFQTTNCYLDNSIVIYDGEDHNASMIGSYCEKMPGLIRSAGNVIHLEVPETSDSTKFTASYSVLESNCGGTLGSPNGEFSSPNYPSAYPVDTQCEWLIYAGFGIEVSLEFTTFELVKSQGCNEDYLEIRETNGTGRLIGIYCGDDKPLNVTGMGALWVYFKSDRPTTGSEGTTGKGFLAEFSISTYTELSSTKGYYKISSPLYPENYIGSAMYKWLISAPVGYNIIFEFNEVSFDMTSMDACYGASLSFAEGEEFGDHIATICSMNPSPIKSTTNTVFLTFTGGFNYQSKFLLEWRAVKQKNETNSTCGSGDSVLLVNSHSQINHTYTSQSTWKPCNWIFTTSPGRHFRVVFTTLNMTSFHRCMSDTMIVYDANGYGPSDTLIFGFKRLATVCNSTSVGKPIETTGDSLKIQHSLIYHRRNSRADTRVIANITDVCGGNLKKSYGVIIINGKNETKVGQNLECKWKITVPTGRYISLDLWSNFTSKNCEANIQVHNGHNQDSPVILKHCGAHKNVEGTKSTGNIAYITFIGNYTDQLRITFTAVSSTDCGGEIMITDINNSTVISTPNYPNAPPAYTECIWKISVPNGESIRMDVIERFDLMDTFECVTEGLEIRDGATHNSELLGKFCKDTPGTQRTISNHMYIRYYTESTDPNNGFKAKVSIAFCGSILRSESGSLTSPAFKIRKSYPVNKTCEWIIEVPPYHNMNLTFDYFDLPTLSSNITIEDITFLNKTDRIIYTYKGFKPKKNIQSYGNKVKIHYYSGRSGNYDGFKLSFVASTERCGGELTTTSGTITSPNYPASERTRWICEWLITVPKGRRIKLVLEDIDFRNDIISQGIACFSGDSFSSSLLFLTDKKKYEDRDKVVRSSDNTMKVYFWSYGEQSNRGFKASYTSDEASVCVGDMTSSSGVIKSPTDFFTCKWKPEPKMTKSQTLAFTISATFTNSTSGCSYGQTSIFFTQGGTSTSSFYPYVIAQLCKTTEDPFIVRTILPYPEILANNRRNSSQMDFTIKYKVYNCGGEIKTPVGQIVSPKSSDLIECAWALIGNTGEQQKIAMIEFNLDCDFSYLLVYNGPNSKSPLLGKYCGQNKLTTLTSQKHSIWLEYHGGNGSSFKLNYERMSKICGGVFHDASDVIQTPSYPSNYDNNEECLWELRAKNGYHISLKFEDRFQLESSEGCSNDYVAIYNNENEESNATRHCGRNVPPSINSTGNSMFILFRTNERITGSGFRANWNWACGGTYTATKEKQYIMSPEYPDNYANGLRCEYLLNAPGKVILITFESFDLEASSNCRYDKLIVKPPFRRKTLSYCGNEKPDIMQFNQHVNLTFISDRLVTRKGFKFSYEIYECGGEITEPVLLEKTFVKRFNTNTYYYLIEKCNWNIMAPPNKRIRLRFQKVNITYNIYCFSQFVSVFDEKNNKMASLCGDLPTEDLPTINSLSSNLTLKFQYYTISSRPADFKVFIDFQYGPEVGCGSLVNLIYKDSQNIQFTPPGLDFDCLWHIETGVDYTIKIEFGDMATNTCTAKDSTDIYSTDGQRCCIYYEMRNGNTTLADVIYSGCDVKTFNYVSSGPTAQLRIAGRSAQIKIPRITISRQLSICGHLNLVPTNDTQYISSPRYPKSYPINIRCIWRFKTKPLGAILFTFEDFDLNPGVENITECTSRDRLELADRMTKAFHLNYDLVSKQKPLKYDVSNFNALYGPHLFCTTSSKGYEFISIQNQVQISFISNNNSPKSGKGFKIGYKLATCNRTYTGPSGLISKLWNIGNCTTTIRVKPNETIALYFSSFFPIACSIRAIEVYDGPSATKPSTKLCGYSTAQPVFSTGNELIVKFVTIIRYGTFTSDMTYVASDVGRGCGGQLYMFKGMITSPLYPNAYTSETLCRWNIRVPLGLQVAFKVKWFDLKGTCTQAYIKMFDSTQSDASTQIYCPEDTPAVFISQSGFLTVEYKSSIANTGTGWSGAFMAITSDVDFAEFKTQN